MEIGKLAIDDDGILDKEAIYLLSFGILVINLSIKFYIENEIHRFIPYSFSPKNPHAHKHNINIT